MGLSGARRQPYRQTIAIAWILLVKPPRDPPIDWRWFPVMQAPC